MKHKIVVDIDSENEWRTIVVEMVNTIERPNVYTIYTTVTDGYNVIYKTSEIKGHEQALKYFIAFKTAKNIKDCCGFEIIHKQTLITKKNPYISKMEHMKRFLWE